MTTEQLHAQPEVVHASDQTIRVNSADGELRVVVHVDHSASTALLEFAVMDVKANRAASEGVLSAIFALPELAACHEIKAALPLGACDLVKGLTDRVPGACTRAAGVTCLLEATIDNRGT